MHKVDQQEDDEGENHFVLTGGAKNALVACQRFYSNISTDYERQQSMDLLLGIFEPKKDEAHIWEHKHRARHLRVGKLGRRTSDLLAGPIPLPTQILEDPTPVSEKEVASYISTSRAAQASVAMSASTLRTRPGFRIEVTINVFNSMLCFALYSHHHFSLAKAHNTHSFTLTLTFIHASIHSHSYSHLLALTLIVIYIQGLAGQFFHTASLIRIALTVFSDLVEEADIESVTMNKVTVMRERVGS